MSINHDDRALIQLILVRGKSYDDIGGLLGTDRDSVRNRAHEALARLESVDRAEYKRRQSPPGLKVTPKGLGRDRRMPITNRFGTA